MEKITKTVGDIVYTLMHSVPVEENGIRYQVGYWLEGAGYDLNGDDVISNITLRCRIPEGKKGINFKLLNENCLTRKNNTLVVNEDLMDNNSLF